VESSLKKIIRGDGKGGRRKGRREERDEGGKGRRRKGGRRKRKGAKNAGKI